MNLVARGLACGYGSRTVLSGLNFTLSPGEFVSLIGPNGVGKSTLLRTLVGFLRPFEGEALLGGTPLSHVPPAERARAIAYVPQAEPQVFDFTVEDVVRMGRTPHGDEASYSVESALSKVDLLALRDRPVTAISGGELQRTLMARAFAQDTPLLLLDEPTAHLDIGHQSAVMGLLRVMVRQGKGALCVLQDLNLASEFSDRVLLAHPDGSLVAGAPTDVLREDRLKQLYGDTIELTTRPGSGRPAVFVKS